MIARRLAEIVACGVGALLSVVAFAQSMPPDAPGGADHPAITRYVGSWMLAQEQRDFDEVAVPLGPAASAKLEGHLTRLFYLAPADKTPTEVQRNYELALERAGATRLDGCAESCGQRSLKRLVGDLAGKKMSRGDMDGWSAETILQSWLDDRSARYWYGTLSSAGRTLHIVVMTSKSDIIALSSKHAATLLMIVEPRAMQTGKVDVDANAIAKGLQTDGRMALYGIYFDTGKSELRSESKSQMDEIARMLQANAAMKVFIVGHTDNQGVLEANVALSRARAQAVVDALVKNYRIDGKRLAAAGIANYAPVANNTTDTGRARNRRVEIVVQ